MKSLAVAAFVLACACSAVAQTPEPAEPPPPTPAPPAKPKSSIKNKFFFGGGLGATFGTVDYIEVAPLVGLRAAPRVDVGVQPFYRWTNDNRYATSYSATDYGARLFTRVRIVSRFFVEVDYQYTSYEYYNGLGTTRASNNAFLAGGGYVVPFSENAGMYFSALYDFSYDDDALYTPYDSPVQIQFGFSVWF